MEDITAELDRLDDCTPRDYVTMNITDMTLGVDPQNYPEEVLRKMMGGHDETAQRSRHTESTVVVEEVEDDVKGNEAIVGNESITGSEFTNNTADTIPASPLNVSASPPNAPASSPDVSASRDFEDNIDNNISLEDIVRLTEQIKNTPDVLPAGNTSSSFDYEKLLSLQEYEVDYTHYASERDARRAALDPDHPPGRVIHYWEDDEDADNDDTYADNDTHADNDNIRDISRKIDKLTIAVGTMSAKLDKLITRVEQLTPKE